MKNSGQRYSKTPPSTASSGHPSRSACMRLLCARGVPRHIIDHSALVADVATTIARDLVSRDGPEMDIGLLEAAALLHDICKADTFGKPLMDHAVQGGALMRETGYPRVADIIEQHIYVTEKDCRRDPGESQLLCYADKRVLHDRIVSLDERYDDLVSRYGSTASMAETIEGNRVLAKRLEDRIFSFLPYGPVLIEARCSGSPVSGTGGVC